MTDLSLLNPGTSLQLEQAGTQDEEEAEFHQEEQEKEKELRELLTNAFDDFIEEDILSECSHDGDLNSSRNARSADNSRHESTPLEPPRPYAANFATAPKPCTTSTPAVQNVPHFTVSSNGKQSQEHMYYTESHYPPFMEDSPQDGAAQHWQHHQPHSHVTGQAGAPYIAEDGQYGLPNPVASRERGQWEHGQVLHGYDASVEQHYQANHVIGQREEAEGGNENNQLASVDTNSPWYHAQRDFYAENYDPLQQQHHHQQEHDVYAAQATNEQALQQQQQPYYHDPTNSGETFAPNQHHLHGDQQGYMFPHDAHETQGYVPSHPHEHDFYTQSQTHETHDLQAYAQSQSYETSQQPASLEYPQFQRTEPPSDRTYSRAATLDRPAVPAKTPDLQYDDNYKVIYGRDNEREVESSGPFDRHSQGADTGVDQDLSSNQRELGQLKVLYQARGRKLEELTAEFESYKQESSREIRILKHQLSIAQGDRDGMETSVKQCQNLLQSSQGEITELKGKLRTAEAQTQALQHSKEELISKLSSAETNLENLNEQLAELGQSDSLERARVQHQSVVTGLQQKYDKEILTLKERQDALQEVLSDKEKEVKSLRQQLSHSQHQAELAQISRAETINRLTKSLEESQKQCQSLLESSVAEELAKTKSMLKQKTAAKSMVDEMCQALQEELTELREQLSMFESASNLGVFSTGSTSKTKELHDDSMADLGIKKTLDFKTPESITRSAGVSDVPDDYVGKLKMELERCLMSNKTKRALVAKLQAELRATKSELAELSSRCERAEKTAEELKVKLKDYEDEFSPKDGDKVSVVEKRLRKELDNLRTEKDALLAEIQDLKHRLEEIASSEEKVNEINRELNAEMSQMIRDYDHDKREGLDKCHQAYMQMVEDAKARVREEGTSAAETEKKEVIEKYESELVIVRDELRGAWKEVDNAKELYIKLSQEKNELEERLKESFHIELETEIQSVKTRMLIEKEEAVDELKKTLESEKKLAVTSAREDWFREQESVLSKKMQTQLAEARADWLKEQSSSLQDTIDSAIHAAELEWKTQHEVEKAKELEASILQAKEVILQDKASLVENEVKNRLEQERQKWIETTEKTKVDDVEKGLNEEFQTLKKDIVNVRAENEKLTDKNNKLQNETDNYKTENANLCEQTTKLQKDMDNLSLAHRKAEDGLKTEIQHLKTEFVEVDTKCHKLQGEKASLQETLQKEIGEMQAEMTKLLLEKSKLQESALVEVEKLREENVKLQIEKEKLTESARTELEEKVKQVVKEAEEKFRVELEKTVSSDKGRELSSDAALQERIDKEVLAARKLWQSEDEVNRATAVFEAQEALRTELEARYQEQITVMKEETSRCHAEAEKLRSESTDQRQKWAEEREAIVREKDTERKRCVEEIQSQCEEDIKQFMENHQHTLTSALKAARQQQTAEKHRFEDEIKQLKTRELQLISSLRSTPNTSENSENGRVASEGETTQGSHSTNCDNCEHLEKELKSFKDLDNLEQMREEKEQLKEKVTKYNNQVKKLLQDRQKLQVSVQNLKQRQQLEEQHLKLKKQNSSSDDSNVSDEPGTRPRTEDQLRSQLQRTEALLREMDEKRLSQLDELRASLEAENTAAIEAVKKKTAELRKSQLAELEKVKRKFSEEKQELIGKLEKMTSASRQLTSTPVQTETSEAEKNAILEVRAHYIDAVSKIREDVLKHVTETNLRAAHKIKEELARGRKSLVLEMKTTCLQVIRNVLDRSQLGINTTAISSAIEKQLEVTTAQIAKGKTVRKKGEESNSYSERVGQKTTGENSTAKHKKMYARQTSNKSKELQEVDSGAENKNELDDPELSHDHTRRKKDYEVIRNLGTTKGTYASSESTVSRVDKVNEGKSDLQSEPPCDIRSEDVRASRTRYEQNFGNGAATSKPFVSIDNCDISNQTTDSDMQSQSLNMSDSVYMPLAVDSTNSATQFAVDEEESRCNSLPSRTERMYCPKSTSAQRDVSTVGGALQIPNGKQMNSKRQLDLTASLPQRTRSSSPVRRQTNAAQNLSAGRSVYHSGSMKETPASNIIANRTDVVVPGISGVTLSQRFKSVTSSGAPSDSGLGSLGRERRSGLGVRRANTLSAPLSNRDIAQGSQGFSHSRPHLFRQSSENSLSSSALTQYEDESSNPSTYRSTVEDLTPIGLDTEGTLNSLGLGKRSPRKYNPVPEKPDSEIPRRRLPETTNNVQTYPWRRSLNAYGESQADYNHFSKPADNQHSGSRHLTFAEKPSNFSSNGRESTMSAASDVSYNLRLSSTFDSSIQEPRHQLGQSFIPYLDPPNLDIQGQGRLDEAVRRPVPVRGRRPQDGKSAFSDEQKL